MFVYLLLRNGMLLKRGSVTFNYTHKQPLRDANELLQQCGGRRCLSPGFFNPLWVCEVFQVSNKKRFCFFTSIGPPLFIASSIVPQLLKPVFTLLCYTVEALTSALEVSFVLRFRVGST